MKKLINQNGILAFTLGFIFSISMFLVSTSAFAEVETVHIADYIHDRTLIRSIAFGSYLKSGDAKTENLQVPFHIVDKEGNPLSDEASQNVQNYYLTKTQCDEVKQLSNLNADDEYSGFGMFPNLKILDLTSGATNVDIQDCHALTNFHAPGRVTHINFGYQPNLTYLNLISNQLNEEELNTILENAPNVERYIGWYTDGESSKAHTINFSHNTKLKEIYIAKALYEYVVTPKSGSLEIFSADVNAFNEVDLSGNPNLTKVYLDDDWYLHTLDLSGSPAIETLALTGNPYLGELPLYEFPHLKEFYGAHNNYTSIDVSKNVELKKLELRDNQLTMLDVRGLQNLTDLNASQNQLADVLFENNYSLQNLLLDHNKLNAFDPSSFSNLLTLGLNANQLSEINVSKNLQLTDLGVAYNNLSELDISKNTNLSNVYADFNHITRLDWNENNGLPRVLRLSEQELVGQLTLSGNFYALSLTQLLGDDVDLSKIQLESGWAKSSSKKAAMINVNSIPLNDMRTTLSYELSPDVHIDYVVSLLLP